MDRPKNAFLVRVVVFPYQLSTTYRDINTYLSKTYIQTIKQKEIKERNKMNWIQQFGIHAYLSLLYHLGDEKSIQ